MISTKSKLIKAGAVVALAGAAVFGLSACAPASNNSESSETVEEPGSNVIAPVVVDIADLEGTTVEVQEGNFIDINVPADTEGMWKASKFDDMVLEFSAGGEKDGAIFNPGFKALAVGSTQVEMTDGTTTVTFTVNVTEKM